MDNPSHWLIFFRGVETTNQSLFLHVFLHCYPLVNYGKSPFLMGKSTVNCHFGLVSPLCFWLSCEDFHLPSLFIATSPRRRPRGAKPPRRPCWTSALRWQRPPEPCHGYCGWCRRRWEGPGSHGIQLFLVTFMGYQWDFDGILLGY